jgi:glycosyltransferase involved in cell wall biosynthesis
MSGQERLEGLVDAAEEVLRRRGRTDVHFAVVGDGDARAALDRTVRERDLAGSVELTGPVEDELVRAYICTADVCVGVDERNAMNDRAAMRKILEYMALGKPIVQFDLTEGRFSAQDASLYAKRNDPADFAAKILELIDDPAKRKAMGAFGRRRVQEALEWRYEAPKLLAAYHALWAKPAPRQQPAL